MKHIKTTCDEETKARAEYATIEPGVVVADDKIEALVRRLLDLRKKMDEDALEKSKMMATIMNVMKNKAELKSKDGTTLVTWSQGNSKQVVNYDGLFQKFGIAPDDVAEFTSYKSGSRTFDIKLG